MKNIGTLSIISVLTAILFFSCEDAYEAYNKGKSCENCFEEFPHTVEVDLIFTISRTFPEVYYSVYSGHVENSPLLFSDFASQRNTTIYLEPNTYYSFVAEYYDEEKDIVIYVVSESYTKTKLQRFLCDYECYHVEGTNVDLRLISSYN